tara:strand:+ start:172 stop:1053 length:882 start_codon:yes stop_codon:yes gene_type:complete
MKIKFSTILLISFLIYSCNNEKISDKRNFSIEEIENVNYIELKNKTPKEVKLYKKNGKWELENGFTVNEELIKYLLETLSDMKIKRPLTTNEKSNILKRMSTQRTQVKIFSNKKILKTIYVGGDTQDQLGTYMILDNSSEPYVLEIPGFKGYLSSRFSCEINDWKEKTIFNYKKDEIEKISVKNKDIEKSFEINSSDSISNIYFSNFENINCEKFLKNNNQFSIQEILNREVIFEINIKLKNGNSSNLKAFEKKSSEKGRSKNKKFDTERFYALFKNELILVQYNQFENILNL